MPYALNVPSNLIEFTDGGLTFRNLNEVNKTKSVLVLGFSEDGPLEPVATDIDTVDKIFGKDVDDNGRKTGGTISTYVNDLYKAGCNDIRAMKICGSTSNAKIANSPKLKFTTKKSIEKLGIVEGNDKTTLTLSNNNVVEDSIRVYVNDKLLSSTITFEKTKSQVTIPAGVTEAGATVMVKYDYIKTIKGKKTEETLTVDSDLSATLKNKPDDNHVTVKYNGVELDSSRFEIDLNNHKITLKNAEKKTPKFVESSMISIEYQTSIQVKTSTTDSQYSKQRFVTASSLQTIVLSEEPKSGTFHLYCNDAEVSKGLYVIDGEILKVQKNKLQKDRALECSYLVEKQINVSSSIEFESFFASSVYNMGSVEVTDLKNNDGVIIGKNIIIHKPESKKVNGEEPLTYTSLAYPTFSQLVQAINQDISNGVYKATTDFGDELTSSLNVGIVQFMDGDSGINATKEEIKECLSGKRDEDGYLIREGIYQLLEGYNVDYVLLTGIYADDELSGRDTFDYDLAMFCAAISNKTHITYGVISTRPCENHSLQGIKNYVDRLSEFNKDGRRFLLKKDGRVYITAKGKPIDLGHYIRIVGGPEPYYFNEALGKHETCPSVAYVGLQASLRPQSSPMNKPLPNSLGLRYRLAEPYLQALTKANIICFFQKTDRNGITRPEAYVYDSMTCALPGSDFVRTTACEIAKLIGDDIREVADPYIGEPPTVESKNSFAAALDKRFSERRAEGAVAEVSFEIIETPSMIAIGECRVKVTIRVPGERRNITTTIGLKPPTGR